jgi:hypothetical protein
MNAYNEPRHFNLGLCQLCGKNFQISGPATTWKLKTTMCSACIRFRNIVTLKITLFLKTQDLKETQQTQFIVRGLYVFEK